MRREWFVVVCLIVASAGWLAACGPKEKKPLTQEQIGDMMKKVHKGEQSSLARVRAELKKDSPDWDALTKGAAEFTEMGQALKGRPGYTSPDRYIAAAAGLTKATKDKDTKAANEALKGLTKSCANCHYGKTVNP